MRCTDIIRVTCARQRMLVVVAPDTIRVTCTRQRVDGLVVVVLNYRGDAKSARLMLSAGDLVLSVCQPPTSS